MSDSDGASAKRPPAGRPGGENSCAPRTPIRQGVQSRPPAAMLKGELPAPPDAVESRVSAWVPRPFTKLVPTYRVDHHGLVVTMPGRGSTSLRWVDVQPSLEFSHEIRTEYDGYKSAQKRLVLRTRSGHPSGRCRIELPKLREPAWISVHENSWEVGRAAMLQLLHHAPGPVSVSTDVFLDLEINPGNWKRAWLPKLVSQLYMLAVVAAGLPLTLWVHQVNHAVGWAVGAFVGYAIAMSMLGATLGGWLLPTYFGPGIAFGNDEGVGTGPHLDKAH